MNTRQRRIFKTVTWRILSISVTVTIAFLITKSLTVSSMIGLLDAVVKTFFYYYHESIWESYPSDDKEKTSELI